MQLCQKRIDLLREQTALPTEIHKYSYGNANWGDQLTAISEYSVDESGVSSLTGTQSFAYVGGGNPTTYKGNTATWQGKRLASYTVPGSGSGGSGSSSTAVTYTYNEDGLRTSKTVNGVRTDYYYNGTLLMAMKCGTDVMSFFYDQSGNVIQSRWFDSSKPLTGDNIYISYYMRDGQGNVVSLLSANGTKVVTYEYDTWGNPTATWHYQSTTNTYYYDKVAAMNPFRYRGYIYDSETSLYYCQSRYYDPAIGRFLSPDSLLSTGQGVLGYNMYAYCLNNPVNMKDPSGHAGLFAETPEEEKERHEKELEGELSTYVVAYEGYFTRWKQELVLGVHINIKGWDSLEEHVDVLGINYVAKTIAKYAVDNFNNHKDDFYGFKFGRSVGSVKRKVKSAIKEVLYCDGEGIKHRFHEWSSTKLHAYNKKIFTITSH
jgi:RHS repeat-associated protein